MEGIEGAGGASGQGYSQSNHEYVDGPDSVDTPRTGDENNFILWLLLSSIFAAGALYSLKRLNGKQD